MAEASLVFYVAPADPNGVVSADELAKHHSLATANLADKLEFGTLADPGGGTSLFSSTTSGAINGNKYSMTTTELGYDNGGVFHELASDYTNNFNGTNYRFRNEGTAGQQGASAFGWGYDTDGTGSPDSTFSAQQTFLFDFTGSATDVGTFSFSLLDFESGTALSAYLAVWDESGNYLNHLSVDYGGKPYGNAEAHQAFIQSDDDALGYVAVIVGDNDSPSNFREQVAIGDFYVGGFAVAVPEVSSALPMLALFLVGLSRRKRA
ncbi:MAG: hypothetical protein AAF514_22040 [Verrucomicrobiota bacterium]